MIHGVQAAVYTFIIILLAVLSHAQNLVPNSGFEQLIRCPQNFSAIREDFNLPGWSSASNGTPDHFHSCSWNEAGVPGNWAGHSTANSGNGYAGIYLWMGPNSQNNYREYIQCELIESLQPGVRYRIVFHYKLATHSVFAVNRIGLLVTQDKLNYSHDQVISLVPTLSIEKDTAVTTQTGSWESASMDYIAHGGERYLTIGNFFPNDQTRYTQFPNRVGKNFMLKSSAYYFIDDVSVIALINPDSIANPEVQEFNNNRVELNKRYVLKNIQFEFDQYTLMKSSYSELDQVVKYLLNNSTVEVELSGHTDFIGSDEYNVELSNNRAQQVAEYLVSHGVQADRITAKGFGKSQPINHELTEEARQINRRVEIRFIQPRKDSKF